MSMADDDLIECIASGQWRCTVEEVQEVATRLLREKQALLNSIQGTKMSKHIGVVHSSERNPHSPGVVVDVSRGGVELSCDKEIIFRSADARTFAALLMTAADEHERMHNEASAVAALKAIRNCLKDGTVSEAARIANSTLQYLGEL